MAKSFFVMGQEAGFDMTNEEEMNAFMHLYNAAVLAQPEGLSDPYSGLPSSPSSRKVKPKRKKRRKMTKAARRRNRRKRK